MDDVALKFAAQAITNFAFFCDSMSLTQSEQERLAEYIYDGMLHSSPTEREVRE